MKNKSLIGFAFFIVAFLFILFAALHKRNESISSVNNVSAWINNQSIEQMAILENKMKQEKNKKSKKSDPASTEKADFTKLYPNLYTVYSPPKEMQKDKKIVYLTFDDGPSKNTFKILDILNNNNIKATFFVVGSSIDEEGEDCLIRMVHEGHTIGIHTYSHLCNEIYCSMEHFLDDFNTVYEQIYDITGEQVNIYRFPLGSINGYNKGIKDSLISEMTRRGFTCYDWTASAEDSLGRPNTKSIRKNIFRDLEKQEYPIILLHDSLINDATVASLPSIIKTLKEKGYEFDTLDNREPYLFP